MRRYSSPTGSTSEWIQIAGIDDVHRMLRPFLEPEFTETVFKADRAAAKVYGAALRAAVRPMSKRMARAVRVRTAKSGKPDVIVGTRRKIAFFWPFVIGGTRDHGPLQSTPKEGSKRKQIHSYLTWRTKDGNYITKARVRGVKARPVVEEVTERAAAAAAAAFNAVINGVSK